MAFGGTGGLQRECEHGVDFQLPGIRHDLEAIRSGLGELTAHEPYSRRYNSSLQRR
jgi:hypothetical protein